MKVTLCREWAFFRTNFNEEYDMLYRFTNMIGAPMFRNGQVDFSYSQLIKKDNDDIWNPDFFINAASDEAPPMHVNDAFIGGGHGQPSCVTIYAPNHNKTLADFGAVYLDEEGTKFTIVEVINGDYLKLISENIGESVTKYQFKLEIKGKLSFLSDGEDKGDIIPQAQTPRSYLYSAIKHRTRKVVCYKDGLPKTIISEMECDYAEIWESYDIKNPATVAPAITAERPEGGYKHQPFVGDFGETMITLDQKFIIQPDANIIVDFKVNKVMDVYIDFVMGVMYQERTDLFGGGVYRFLSKLKPITTPEGTFDFSTPYPLRGADYPNHVMPGREYRKYPDNPFDRIIDYFRDSNGDDTLAFTCGFLPVYDGHPEKRKDFVDEIALIYKTRKAYPFFASGNHIDSFRGVAYRKYFKPANRSSVYSIYFEGKKYIYFDFFEENTLTFETKGKVTLFEADGVDYKIENGLITASGKKGFATFIEE